MGQSAMGGLEKAGIKIIKRKKVRGSPGTKL